MARKSPLAYLYALIKTNNSSLTRFLTETNCTAGTPTALTGDSSGKNTSIVVTGVAGSGFMNSATFKYNRIGLADIIAASTTGNTTNIVPNTGQNSLATMVASFNTAYGSNLQVTDVVSATVGALTGGYFGLTLTPTDGHVLFNAGVQIKYKGTFATLTLAGSYTGSATNGTPYSSALTIAGGSGNYSNARVSSGSLPSGLSLSISGTQLLLSGNPDTVGASNTFTVAVDSDDGQTVTSGAQTVVSNGGSLPSIATTWAAHTSSTGLTVANLTT